MMLPQIPSYELARIEDECRVAGVLDEYQAMVSAGQYPRAAAMYALQSPAGTRNTDKAFCQGARKQMENMSDINRKGMQALAKRAGINTDGKFYKGSLGSYTDPAAWVTCADDVLTVAKARNLHVEGVINHKAVDIEPVPKKKQGLAPDIVNRLARKYIQHDKSLAERCRRSRKARGELREKIIARHGRQR